MGLDAAVMFALERAGKTPQPSASPGVDPGACYLRLRPVGCPSAGGDLISAAQVDETMPTVS
jgi:hypothetical protein